MTREEILSIEGVEEYKDGSGYFKYRNIAFFFDGDIGIVDAINDTRYTFEDAYHRIKPISDIEALKQFLNFFDI